MIFNIILMKLIITISIKKKIDNYNNNKDNNYGEIMTKNN